MKKVIEKINTANNPHGLIMAHTTAVGIKHYGKKWDAAKNTFHEDTLLKFGLNYKNYAEAVLNNRSWLVCYDKHVKEYGWSGIGYHVIFEKNGDMYVSEKGQKGSQAIACNYVNSLYGSLNRTCWHVAFAGNGDEEQLTNKQVEAFCIYLDERKGIFNKLLFHKDNTLESKSCPGVIVTPQLLKIAEDHCISVD